MPEKAEVFEKGNAVYVTEAKLKVMLDSDRTAMTQNASESVSDERAAVAKAVMREIVLPAIEKEVNEGKNFAAIRQVYHTAILAKWYRELIQNTLLVDAYVGKNKIAGVTTHEKSLKEEIYQRYIAAYKKGVFNYIKEESVGTGETLPRKYFSGGIEDFAMKNVPLSRTTDAAAISRTVGQTYKVDWAMANHQSNLGSTRAFSSDEDLKALNEDIDRFMASREPEYRELGFLDHDSMSPSTTLNPLFYRAYSSALRLKLLGDVSGIRRLADYQYFASHSNNPYQGYRDRISAELATPDVQGVSQGIGRTTLKSLLVEQRLRIDPLIDAPRGSESYVNSVRLIKDLKSAGIKVGIGTSGGDTEKLLRSFGVNEMDAVVDADLMFKEGIPNKAISPLFYLAVAQKLGIDPGKCVLVEDSPRNIKVLHAAGFGLVIGLARMGHEDVFRDAGAQLVLSDIGNLSVDDIRAELPGVQGVVFDVLGTIVSSLPAHFISFKETIDRYLELRAEQLGEPFREFTFEEFQTFMLGTANIGRDSYGGLKPFFASRNIEVPEAVAPNRLSNGSPAVEGVAEAKLSRIFDLIEPAVQAVFEAEVRQLMGEGLLPGMSRGQAERIVRQKYGNRDILPIHFTKFPDGKEKQYYLLVRQLLIKKHAEGFRGFNLAQVHLLAAIFYTLANGYPEILSSDPEELLTTLLKKNAIKEILEVGTGGNNFLAILLNGMLKSTGGSVTIIDKETVVDPEKAAQKEGVNVIQGFVGPGIFNGKRFDLILSSGVFSMGGQLFQDTTSGYKVAMDLLYDSLSLLSDNPKARIISNGLRSHLRLLKDAVELVAGVEVWDNAFDRHTYFNKRLDVLYRDKLIGFNVLREFGASLVVLKNNPDVMAILDKNKDGRIYPEVITRIFDLGKATGFYERLSLPASEVVFRKEFYNNPGSGGAHLDQYLVIYSVSKEQASAAREIMSINKQGDEDRAMLKKDVGGIDIQNIDVQHKSGSAGIKFNDEVVRAAIQNGFNGFTPVIINITPVESPLIFPRKSGHNEELVAA
ncbi:MAG: HAD-IA family hydrolase [Candidatus Omnitrophica bacterium]|nr:HAD-IA family hydrolase [Candidatus Omnitrophota bacterium]